MGTETRIQLGILVQDPAERALLQAAAQQACLASSELSAWPEVQEQPGYQPFDMIVVDEPARSQLVDRSPITDWPAPLRIEIVPGDHDPAVVPTEAELPACRLQRPLRVEQVAWQLRLLADACRAFAAQHLALREELHRYRRIFDSLSNGVAISDARHPDMPLIYVNPAFAAISGYSAAEVRGRNCRFMQGPERDQEGVWAVRTALAEKREERVLLRNFRKDGTPFWNELYLSPIFDRAGELTHYVGIQNDVTARVEAELQLADQRDRLHAAAESSMDALFICETVRDAANEIIDFVFTYLNSNVAKMVAIPVDALLGKAMCEVFPINRALGLFERYREVVLTGEPLVHEFSVKHKDVLCDWIRVQAVKLKDGVVITASDITLRKREEERTLFLAHHDALTALPNRTTLNQRIEQGLLNADRHKNLLGLFLIDLDGFKQINDTLGHPAGDATLVTVAGRLRHCVRSVDSVLRIGGDEFIVIMPDLHSERDAGVMASRILASLRAPMQIAGQSITVTSSIGIAIYPRSAQSVEELLSRSDLAMYAAKRRGKNQYELDPAGELPAPAARSAG